MVVLSSQTQGPTLRPPRTLKRQAKVLQTNKRTNTPTATRAQALLAPPALQEHLVTYQSFPSNILCASNCKWHHPLESTLKTISRMTMWDHGDLRRTEADLMVAATGNPVGMSPIHPSIPSLEPISRAAHPPAMPTAAGAGQHPQVSALAPGLEQARDMGQAQAEEADRLLDGGPRCRMFAL